jgi:co-chaperonin GroES (HSP10)
MRHKATELRILTSRILVRPDPLPEKIGMIIIPDNVREKHQAKQPITFGTVIAVGPGLKTKDGGRWPMSGVKPGDRVIFKYAEGSYKLKLDMDVEDEETGEVRTIEDVLHFVIRDSFLEGVVELDEDGNQAAE